MQGYSAGIKVLKAGAILLVGPSAGLLIALLLSALALPADTTFKAGGHAAPGDGFFIVLFIVASLVVSVPLSIWGAVAVLSKKT